MYTVYKHTAPNGKAYIGLTGRNPARRWGGGCNYYKQKHFGNAIKKYGWNNFKHEIIRNNLTKEEACQLEKELIAKYKTNDPKHGYNLSTGGESGAAGVVITEATRQKLRETHKGINKGRHLSDETKEKLRKINLGRCAGEKHPFYGKHWTIEQRKMLSEAHKGKQTGKNNPKARQVINRDTQEIYDTLTAAAIAMKRVPSAIANSIKNGTKCAGHFWAYYEKKD